MALSTVLSFNVHNTGKVVQSGETIAEIAPHGSPLVLSDLLPVGVLLDHIKGLQQDGIDS